MTNLNIIFAGTPEFGIPCLEALASTHCLHALFTKPDRPAGRGRKYQASAVKQWGTMRRYPVYQPINFKQPNAINQLAALKPDVLVVIAYGLILPKTVLDIPKFGCINVHASLLPRWRGASPIQHAILAGDLKSGITIMQMDVGMDTGDILAQVNCPISLHETAGNLHDKLAQLAVAPLMMTLDNLAQKKLHAIAQPTKGVTYARKISKDDARINWRQPASLIDRQCRAFNPWPIAYTQVGSDIMRVYSTVIEPSTTYLTDDVCPGTVLSLTKAGLIVATTTQPICIKYVQFSGGNVISIADYLNAPRRQLAVGIILT
jgi:methionyl-tRNA formyltransferase